MLERWRKVVVGDWGSRSVECGDEVSEGLRSSSESSISCSSSSSSLDSARTGAGSALLASLSSC